jgi:hypothetical protein
MGSVDDKRSKSCYHPFQCQSPAPEELETMVILVREGVLCAAVGLGTVAGHLAADPEAVVIWVDAHADINTLTRNSTTPLS